MILPYGIFFSPNTSNINTLPGFCATNLFCVWFFHFQLSTVHLKSEERKWKWFFLYIQTSVAAEKILVKLNRETEYKQQQQQQQQKA